MRFPLLYVRTVRTLPLTTTDIMRQCICSQGGGEYQCRMNMPVPLERVAASFSTLMRTADAVHRLSERSRMRTIGIRTIISILEVSLARYFPKLAPSNSYKLLEMQALFLSAKSPYQQIRR